MEGRELFALTLNQFKENINSTWQELRNDKTFCDITLACEDKQIEAHKVILSASSPIFKAMLAKNVHQHPLFYFRDVTYSLMVSMVDFIYMGEITILEEQLNNFLKLAKDLNIKGLDQEFGDVSKKCELVEPNIYENDMLDGKQNLERHLVLMSIDQSLPIVNSEETNHQNKVKQEHLNSLGNDFVSGNGMENEGFSLREIDTLYCEECEYKTQNKIDLYHHVQSFHREDNKMNTTKSIATKQKNAKDILICDKCNFTTMDPRELNKHQQVMHEGGPNIYLCDKCSYKTTTKRNLKQHTLTKHEGVKIHCDQCNHRAYDKSSLKRHVSSIHTKSYIFCEICDFKTTRVDFFKKHILVVHEKN